MNNCYIFLWRKKFLAIIRVCTLSKRYSCVTINEKILLMGWAQVVWCSNSAQVVGLDSLPSTISGHD